MPVKTLGDALNASWRVTMRCAWGKHGRMKTKRECTYRHEFDITTLVATRSRDFPIAQLEQRLRCPRCGSRRIAVMFDVPKNPMQNFAAGWPNVRNRTKIRFASSP
jgi:hypothetical protein